LKYLFYIPILILPLLVYSQNEEIKTDSLTFSSSFIQDHSNQLNIKLDITNEQINYFMPYGGVKAEIRSNLNVSYGFVFSYKFLSVRLGIRPKLPKSELENKGETDRFRLKVKLLFDKWTHRLEYSYIRGFYIENTRELQNEIENPNFKIQFPYLTTNILSGSSHYKFNDNYSVKAIESNTEIQLNSAGTLLAGVDYALYFLKGADDIKLEDEAIINRDSYNEYYGFSPIFNAGYHYTFVFHKYWYANFYGNPGVGIDFYNTKFYNNNESTSSHNTSVFFTFKTGVSTGYNGEHIYFGGEYNYDVNSEKYDTEGISLQPLNNNFHLFFGYRFKAPKQLRKPVEYIENKVPVLKTDKY
jgi:hypothetical protein|tara:strand:- start:185 stop:1255 length:1071 start_codon:yes stop_codon:yes gene_type:complete